MNEDYWYYEEQQKGGAWISVFAYSFLTKQSATGVMESRKKEHPRAKLRLVHVTRERFSYRNRKAAK